MLKNASSEQCSCMELVRILGTKAHVIMSTSESKTAWFAKWINRERKQALSHTNTVHTLIRKMSSEHLQSVKNELTRLTALHCWKPVRPTWQPQIHHTNTISDRVICIKFMKQDLSDGEKILPVRSRRKKRGNDELIHSKRSQPFWSNIFSIHIRPENGTILPGNLFIRWLS